MCGIAGIIVFKQSTLVKKRIRKLVPALFKELLVRGEDAAGIAVYRSPSRVWVVKDADRPSKFAKRLKRIKGWEEGRIFLLHARETTSCPEYNNYCNHPLVRVLNNKVISLVHNGVLVPNEAPFGVDSSALLYAWAEDIVRTVERWSRIEGTKAILATDGKVVLAYKEHNPLVVAELNNMIIYASTATILVNAAKAAGINIDYKDIRSLDDGDYDVVEVKYS